MGISRRRASIGLLLLPLIASGCAAPPPPPPPPAPPPPPLPPPPPPPPKPIADLVVGEEASGTAIHLHPGQTLALRLPGESGSTGYRWKLISGTGWQLAQTARSYESTTPPPAPGQPVMVGGGGIAIFIFTARHRGVVPLRLALLPPGRGRKPAKMFHVRVHVGPG